MQPWERDAQNLAIEMRLERLERSTLARETHDCRNCGRRISYSVADTVYVHEDGRYYCDDTPTIGRHASP